MAKASPPNPNDKGSSGPAPPVRSFTRLERFGRWLDDIASPWATFIKVISDPFTCILLGAAVLLGWLGPKAIGESGNAIIQVVVAIVTGVAGARIAAVMAAIAQEGKLYASGKMAVRGLRLILTKTFALERRVSGFVHQGRSADSVEVSAAIALRNLDEVLESVRTLQLEVVGSIENWVDVVPDADVSSIFMAMVELREQLTQKDVELKIAVETKTQLESSVNADASALEQSNLRIAELEREKQGLEEGIASLRKAAAKKPKEMSPEANEAYARLRAGFISPQITSLLPSQPSAAELMASYLATEKHPLPK
ncbi:TPA: hypothetical protein UN269_001214 [Stenotrophomonas maltophilia]|nr:hypothetical protein [Stenotrophomonas maltophilia]